jgi:Spy/CpxP family protein refolding chaperone
MTGTTRRTLTTAVAAALAIVASALASNAATTADTPSHVSPATAERLYTACIQGAPTTPDAHERWVANCRERASAGLS